MDRAKIAEALKRTVDPNQTKEANAFLDSVQKIIGFAPLILEVVMRSEEEPAVRQAGAIYLKNFCARSWESSDETVFNIHEQDRHIIRQSLLPAISKAPEPIRIQLAAIVTTVVKADFPGRWPDILESIAAALDTSEAEAWAGSLLVLYRLVKVYEYKKASERAPLTEAMKVLLPLLYARMTALMPDHSAESVFLQKLLLKILYALVQFSLNFHMLTMEEFGGWLILVKEVVDREVPAQTLSVDEEDRAELVWWKAKKWAMHLLARVFERYGSPGNVEGKYKEFAELYLRDYAEGAIQTALKVAFRKRDGEYVSPRVLNQALAYLENAVSHANCWKWIRGSFDELILSVIFPLLCHSEADSELWEEDPAEYVKAKYDIFEDLISPASSAATFLAAAMKRKGQLKKTLDFVAQVFTNPATTSRQADGGLHILGVLAPALFKKKMYKKGMEQMVLTYVLPMSEPSRENFLRARAMWVIHSLSEAPYSSQGLGKVVEAVTRCLLNEDELPIQTEAAMALQMLLADQAKAEPLFRPHICPIVQKLMNLLRSVESEDLAAVMDRLLSTYPEEITPIAVETAQSLASLFQQIVSSDSMEDRSVAAMGILGTLESVISVMEDHREIMLHLENIVLGVIKVVFDGNYMDFYEEILSLIESLTTTGISAPMWEVFDHLFSVFQMDGMDFFMDMMPCLHNYLTVDTPALLSHPERLQRLYQMGKFVLEQGEDESGGWGEDSECHAGKLLECMILQCGQAIQPILPEIMEVPLRRLRHSIETSELRTMMLQCLIAALHSSPAIALNKLSQAGPDVLPKFLAQWISDSDCFFGIHDRKLSIIGLCGLLGLGEQRPPLSEDLGRKLLPSLLLLFEGLERAYKAEAEMANAETDSGSDSEEEGADEGLDSDEDEVDEEGKAYLQRLARQEKENGGGGDSGRATGEAADDESLSDDEEWDFDENDLEIYDTPLDKEGSQDEYITFKDTLSGLSQSEEPFYQALMASLNAEQSKELGRILQLAEQRLAARTSKAIAAGGGYDFSANADVPASFNFGPR